MSTLKKATPTVVLDLTAAEEVDGVDTMEHANDGATSAFSDEVAAPTCPLCGELLAWHEEPCNSAIVPAPDAQAIASEVATDFSSSVATSRFTYAIGQPVQPAPTTQAGRVIWRGQVKERHPRTGLLHRVNVYRLDNGYWDCYYEAELEAA